ncbi:HAD family hydrolase [Haladaptatus cibarius]|uniref:HAD family hydrolase n=1 Tax=Haladaptatus cibarius TaxID=453847 RepID=UPI000679B7DF|nr:HAD family hydrolase [Haladaptatus cibarius]
MTYDALLFDMDGVLLDFPPEHPEVYRRAVASTFEEFGVEPADADLDAFISGATVEDMRRACAEHDIEFETFWPKRERNASRLQCAMMDSGERRLYDDCRVLSKLADTHDMGVVSSNQHATVEYLLTRFGFEDSFDAVYGRIPTVDGFRRTKPATYYLERAMADLDGANGLYIGDSACDVVAAHSAGLDSVFIRRSHREGYALPEAPTHEVSSLADLHDLSGVVSDPSA